MNQSTIRVFLTPSAKEVYASKEVVPFTKSDGDSGYDLLSMENVVIGTGERVVVGLGIHTEMDNSRRVSVRPRSGLAAKHGIMVVNSPGTIDASYRGEWKVILLNTGSSPYTINIGDKICQAIVEIVTPTTFSEVEELGDLNMSLRGAGGFNSTGY